MFGLIKFVSKYKENFLLASGHFATDICQGSVSAALAVMFAHNVLSSNIEVSYLVLASCLVSSIIQPIIGWLSDRKPRPYLMALGMFVAAFGLMFIGFIKDFYLLFVLITCSGIGVAIFHPQAGKMSNCVSAQKKGLGMSIFSLGGNFGFAAGPAVISLSTLLFGLPGIIAVGIPALIMIIVYAIRNKTYKEYAERELAEQKTKEYKEKEYIGGFIILMLAVFARATILIGLTTFIPLYFMSQFNLSAQEANFNLTIIALCAAIASITGGILADKYGFKFIFALSSTILIPFMALFCSIEQSAVWATIVLIPTSLALYGTLSVSMVLGQKFLCRHVGFASGITIGLGISFGGLTSPLLGSIGDTYGLSYTMWTLFFVSILTCILAWLTPNIDKLRKEEALNHAKTKEQVTN